MKPPFNPENPSTPTNSHKKRTGWKRVKKTHHPVYRGLHQRNGEGDAPLNFRNVDTSLPCAESMPYQDIRRDFSTPEFQKLLESSLMVAPLQIQTAEVCTADHPRGMVVGIVDEEEVFNLPALLDSMAEGMLLTPMAMKKGFSWSPDDDGSGDDELTLWRD